MPSRLGYLLICAVGNFQFKLPQMVRISGGLSAKEAQRLLRIWDQATMFFFCSFCLLGSTWFNLVQLGSTWFSAVLSLFLLEFQDTDGELTPMELGGVVQLGCSGLAVFQ